MQTADRLAELSLATIGETGSISLHDLQLDYVRTQYPDVEALGLIHGAVRLSAHVIERDALQFASQLMGRLLPHREIPAIRAFTEGISAEAPKPWLQPLREALHPPGTPLVEGYSAEVSGVAMTADGGRAVSASWEKTLKVWDLESGRALRTLAGYFASVNGVAMTADGRRAVSASWEKTLKVWDLESGARCARWKATLLRSLAWR